MFVYDFVCRIVVVDTVLGVVVESSGSETAFFGTEAVRVQTQQINLFLHVL